MNVLLVGKERTQFGEFVIPLQEDNRIAVEYVTSAKDALGILSCRGAEVVIAAADLADSKGIELVQTIARTHPLVNIALMSSLSPEDFHEATEGLGLFMQISDNPGQAEGYQMITRLNSINTLLIDELPVSLKGARTDDN